MTYVHTNWSLPGRASTMLSSIAGEHNERAKLLRYVIRFVYVDLLS